MEEKQESVKNLYQKGWNIDEIAKTLRVEKDFVEECIRCILSEPECTHQIIGYTLNELAEMIENPPYKYVNVFDGKPVHQILDSKPLPGEVFKEYPENKLIKVSNLGRIKINNEIIEQWEEVEENRRDYLYVKIGHIIDTEKDVYRFVAKTWCKKPYNSDNSIIWQVHHISNNGYDNRPSNLLWVTPKQHSIIDPRPWERYK
jgi:hypothetical protein